MDSQSERVKRYYASTEIDYRLFWTGPVDLAMHFGYWDASVKSHSQSLEKMNELLAGYGGIRPDSRVLDAGCGFGGSAIWLAKHIGCRVDGVTLVPKQAARATQQAAVLGLAGTTNFLTADYTQAPFPDNSFDIVWAQESFVHAEDKQAAVSEAYRLLRPDGRFIMAEYLLRDTPPLSESERQFLQPWLKGWAMPSLLSAPEYRQRLTAAGFTGLEFHDLTPFVLPSLRRLGRLGIFGLPLARLLRALRIINAVHFGNLEGALIQYRAVRRGLWRYVAVTARKEKR